MQEVVVRALGHRPAGGVAERHRERVDDVLARGGRRPRVVGAVSELDVEVHAREGRTVGVDPGTVDVLLHEDLRREVGHLRAHDRQRVAASRVLAADQQRVGHRVVEAQQSRARVGRGAQPQAGMAGPGRVCRSRLAGGRRATDDLIDGLHGAGVGQRDRLGDGLARRRQGLVGELGLVDGGGRLGVVGVIEAEEGGKAGVVGRRGLLLPLGLALPRRVLLGLLDRDDRRRAGHRQMLAAEPLGHVLVELSVVELVAPAVAEYPAHQRGDRDEVLQRERRRPLGLADGGVLGRHHRQVVQGLLGLVDVGVDPVDVARGVGEELLAARAVVHVVDLVDEVLLGVGLVGPHLLVHRDVGSAGEGREVALTGVAQRVDEEQAVLGSGIADPEHQLGAGVAVDVGHPELLVTHDRHPRLGGLGALRVTGRDPERRVLEVVRDRGRRDRSGRRGQVGVHRELVVVVLRASAGGLELSQLRGVVKAVGPRGQDVAKAAVVACPVRLHLGLGGRHAQERGTGRESGDFGDAPEHGAQTLPANQVGITRLLAEVPERHREARRLVGRVGRLQPDRQLLDLACADLLRLGGADA